jgi:DNA helicase TIP49 (TBP-interacting protein)
MEMSSRKAQKASTTHFKTLLQSNVPQGRNGKHKEIVTTILDDLQNLKKGSALRIPLTELAESKAKVRSALNRATRKLGRNVVTASDGDSLYVWNGGESEDRE